MRHWPNEELVRWASRLPPDATPVLEVGCGNGPNLAALPRPVGLDLVLPALQLARRNGHQLLRGSATSLPVLSQSCGAVVDVLTLQHLTWLDHHRAYEEILRVLRPGGRFFSLHFADTESSVIERIFPGLGVSLSVDPDELEAGLSLMGFRVATELVRKSYKHRSEWVSYCVVDAEKP